MDSGLFSSIAAKVRHGEINRQKAAAFHTEVLLNAERLIDVDAKDFCEKVGMPESYNTEFHKMMRVADMLRQLGYRIEKN